MTSAKERAQALWEDVRLEAEAEIVAAVASALEDARRDAWNEAIDRVIAELAAMQLEAARELRERCRALAREEPSDG